MTRPKTARTDSWKPSEKTTCGETSAIAKTQANSAERTWARRSATPASRATTHMMQARTADAAKRVSERRSTRAALSARRTGRPRGARMRATSQPASAVTTARCVPETAMRCARPVVREIAARAPCPHTGSCCRAARPRRRPAVVSPNFGDGVKTRAWRKRLRRFLPAPVQSPCLPQTMPRASRSSRCGGSTCHHRQFPGPAGFP